MLPDRWTHRVGGGPDRVVLQIESGELIGLYYSAEGVGSEFNRVAVEGADPGVEQAFAATVRSRLDDKTGAVLLLSSHSVVRRRLSLPAATLQNLRQVLAFEMDHHTPFRAEDVYYDFHLLDQNGGTLTLELIAAPRVTVDGWIERLAAMGIPLSGVGVMPADQDRGESCSDCDIDLLPDECRPDGQEGVLNRVNVSLAAVVALLVVLVLAIPLIQMHSALEDLQAQVGAARVRAEEVAALRDQLQARVEEMQQLVNRKHQTAPMVELFAELARILPDHTWLRNVQVKTGKFLIQGESESASGLLGLIGNSPHFNGMSFVSPVTQNPLNGRERFQISLQAEEG